MKRMLTFVIVTALLLGITSISVAQSTYAGVVTVDSAKVRPSETVGVKVWLRDNNISVSAMTLPLKFSSSALTNTSILTLDISAFATDISNRTAHFLDAVPTSNTQPAQEC